MMSQWQMLLSQIGLDIITIGLSKTTVLGYTDSFSSKDYHKAQSSI